MVVIGNADTPYALTELELVGPLSVNDVVTPFELESIPRASNPIANRFPVPPVAWAFLTVVEAELEFDRVSSSITGAVYPESPYLESTIGQIWPR